MLSKNYKYSYRHSFILRKRMLNHNYVYIDHVFNICNTYVQIYTCIDTNMPMYTVYTVYYML